MVTSVQDRKKTGADLPATHEEMVQAIAASYEGLSKRLKQIAAYALDHPNDFAIDTIAETAHKADVHPSALIRFAQAFGFDGFTDVQKLFQRRLLEAHTSYEARLKSVRDAGDNTPPALLERFTQSDIAALEHLRDVIPADKLEKAIGLLGSARVIHIMAMHRAFPLAAYFYYAAASMRRRVQLIDNTGGMGREQLNQIAPDDALFVASFSSYTPEVIHAAEETHRRGIPVVAITDHPLSPLIANSSICFHVRDAAVHDFRSLGASMCLVQTLVVGLGAGA
ncbi:MAG TPA: MurR/RpiR family transcriptional regulator [Rhodobacteraceae bacterium]|nr:MurR/RpiR family transcriptional regulator [Paracoccaceae bacterium]